MATQPDPVAGDRVSCRLWARRSPQGCDLSIDPQNAGEPPAEFLGRSPSRI
ncbi:MAG: hypothetical protein ACAF42_01105 [Limnothrix sp. BL-A-16]